MVQQSTQVIQQAKQLQVQQPVVQDATIVKKKSRWWIWLILAFVVIGLIGLILLLVF
jgi:hypothetical protein